MEDGILFFFILFLGLTESRNAEMLRFFLTMLTTMHTFYWVLGAMHVMCTFSALYYVW